MSVARFSRVIAFTLLAVIGASSCLSAEPGKRIALVIGNSAYKHTSPLANPVNDAEDVAKTLTTLGFQVTKGLDLNKTEMERTLSGFASALKGAGIGLFFYAGHGMQVSGQNYLLPVDARLESASALDFEAVRLDVVQRTMENETTTNVLILDACRDNPLTRNLARALGTRSSSVGKGLAAQESGAGTIISYSTQPGNVALDGLGERNSPFAGALVRHLPMEGKDLAAILVKVRNDVMAATARRQVPWEHSALTSELVLTGATANIAPKIATPGAEAAGTGKNEEATRIAEQKTATTKPSAAPVSEATSNIIFVDSFNGSSISNHWEIKNENKNGYLVENNALYLLAESSNCGPIIAECKNVFALKNVKLDGDWDISLSMRPEFMQRSGSIQVGLVDGEKALARTTFSIEQCSGSGQVELSFAKSEESSISAEKAIWQMKGCSSGSLSKDEYSEKITKLKAMGGVLTLSKRGRSYFGKFESPTLMEPVVIGPTIILHASGQPAFALRSSEGQSAAYVDEFRITRVKQEEATAQ